MWDRKELKAAGKAKQAANRVNCIIAALLLTFTGVGGGAGFSSTTRSATENTSNTSENIQSIPNEVWTILGGAVIAVILISILVSIFLMYPLQVGIRKFFIENSKDQTASINGENIGFAFNHSYKNAVTSMFTTHLFVFLWALLLIVPGVIKALEYRMVPYLLAENPEMTGAEARAKSSRMMNGSKWKAFVLDLSFIGWELLGCLTLGILNLLFTNPYKAATDAELFMALNGEN